MLFIGLSLDANNSPAPRGSITFTIEEGIFDTSPLNAPMLALSCATGEMVCSIPTKHWLRIVEKNVPTWIRINISSAPKDTSIFEASTANIGMLGIENENKMFSVNDCGIKGTAQKTKYG